MAGSRSRLLRSLEQRLVTACTHGRINNVQALLARGAPVNTRDGGGLSCLMLAAFFGYVEIVKLLLEAGADHTATATIKEAGNVTALFLPVIQKHTDIVQLLLDAGADPNVVTEGGISPTRFAIGTEQPRVLELLLSASLNGPMTQRLSNLAYASQENKVWAVKILLDHGALPFKTPDNGLKPLLLAASKGHLEIIRLLMGDVSLPLSAEALRDGREALWEAAGKGQLSVLNCLLEMGIPFDGFAVGAGASPSLAKFKTPLVAAVAGSHLAAVERLIAAGADVNWTMEQSNPPLWEALGEGNVEITKVLIKAGANVHAISLSKSGINPLAWASAAGYTEIVNLLLDAGADPNRHSMPQKTTPLYEATAFGHEDVVQILVERGAFVNLAEGRGLTAVFVAASKGKCGILALLLAAGADPNIPMKTGITPLMAAANYTENETKCLGAMQQLLNAGADINAIDDENMTSLVYACSLNNEAAARYLVEQGADVNIISAAGFSPLLLYACGGNLELVKLLLGAGADVNIRYEGMTPLQYAGKGGHRAVVEVLLVYQVACAALG